MRRLSIFALIAGFAAPAFAQQEGFCMTSCQVAPGRAGAIFTCEDPKIATALNDQGIPNRAVEAPPILATMISEHSPNMGNNSIFPGETKIFYLCGMP